MLNAFLYNLAIVGTAYAWLRFCDWKLKPWLNGRADGYSATLEAVHEIRSLMGARDVIHDAGSDDILTDADRFRVQSAIDRRIEQVMERINRA